MGVTKVATGVCDGWGTHRLRKPRSVKKTIPTSGMVFLMCYLKKTRLYLVPLKGSDLCGISEPLKMREFVLIWNFLVICFPVGVSSSRTVFPPV